MKPAWLDKKINFKSCATMQETLRDLDVATVCEQARCPNTTECFLKKEATFLILGRRCTRGCSFCNIEKLTPLEPDVNEPSRVAVAVKRLGLKHVVITSVTRDDLADGGAEFFAQTVRCIRESSCEVKIEVLVPDFGHSLEALETVINSQPDIIAHNLETVPSLYKEVRQGANYFGSLNLLRIVNDISTDIKIKSGLMLGLGESQDEVSGVMQDLRSVGCDFLSMGQYLSPTKQHYPVKEYVTPEQFSDYKKKAKHLGFLHVESGPYVRSSYMASEYLS